MSLVKSIGCVLLYGLFYDGSAFKIFDVQPLIERSQIANLTAAQVVDVVNIDIGGEYSTLKFQYNNDQNAGLFDDPKERCNADHVRCLTSILSGARPVCVISIDGKISGMATLCDAYLSNCRQKKYYWQIVDSGNCDKAKSINVYGFPPNTVQVAGLG